MKTLFLMYSGSSIIEFPLPSPNPLCRLILCLSIHLPNLSFSLSIILTLTCSELNSCPPNTPAPEVLLPRPLPQSSSDHMGLLIHLAIHCPALFLSSVGTAYPYSWSAECSGENSWTLILFMNTTFIISSLLSSRVGLQVSFMSSSNPCFQKLFTTFSFPFLSLRSCWHPKK